MKQENDLKVNGVVFEDYIQSIYSKIIKTTKLGNELPTKDEIPLLSKNDQKKLKNESLVIKK
jgi:hypothetical protein